MTTACLTQGESLESRETQSIFVSYCFSNWHAPSAIKHLHQTKVPSEAVTAFVSNTHPMQLANIWLGAEISQSTANPAVDGEKHPAHSNSRNIRTKNIYIYIHCNHGQSILITRKQAWFLRRPCMLFSPSCNVLHTSCYKALPNWQRVTRIENLKSLSLSIKEYTTLRMNYNVGLWLVYRFWLVNSLCQNILYHIDWMDLIFKKMSLRGLNTKNKVSLRTQKTNRTHATRCSM